MANSNHHPDCPRCKGEGFYLRREGHGFYRDGSFGHNDWQDCDCYPDQPVSSLPKPVDASRPLFTRAACLPAAPTGGEREYPWGEDVIDCEISRDRHDRAPTGETGE